jgi:tetratricopeptide (TPR) repeat protein
MKDTTLAELDTRAASAAPDARVTLWERAAADDDDPRLHARLGLARLAAGVAGSTSALEQAVADPLVPEAWTRIARARLARGDVDGALSAATLAAAHPGASADALTTYAVTLQAGGRPEHAMAQAEELAHVRPDDPDALAAPVLLHLMQGAAANARTRAEALTRQVPTFARGWLYLGYADAHLGDRERAITDFQRALQLDPRVEGGWEALGGTLRDHGRLAEAADAWNEGLRRAPEDGRLHARLADLALRRGRPDEALTHGRAASRLLPEDIEALLTHGRVAAAAALPDEARGAFEALLARPNVPPRARQVATEQLAALRR